jgi:hypothetical protein
MNANSGFSREMNNQVEKDLIFETIIRSINVSTFEMRGTILYAHPINVR